MSVMPRDKVGQIGFTQSHLDKWLQNAEAIGSSPERIEELAAKVAEAKEAFNQQQELKNRARSATLKFNLVVDAMSAITQEVINQAKITAAKSGNQVYSLAMIPMPKQASPIGELATPYSFKIQLNSEGSITLKWKCTQPRGATGVVYQVERKIKGSPGFVPLGTTGTKQFTDDNIPPGTSEILYRVRAIRSTGAGQWQNQVVFFTATREASGETFFPKNVRRFAA